MTKKHGFGVSVSECTDEQLEYQITYHETQILYNQVGTPNVYVRLGDLKREFDLRSCEQ